MVRDLDNFTAVSFFHASFFHAYTRLSRWVGCMQQYSTNSNASRQFGHNDVSAGAVDNGNQDAVGYVSLDNFQRWLQPDLFSDGFNITSIVTTAK